MIVLVTGGIGYIGSHIVLELIENGHTPVIIDNEYNSDISRLCTLEKIAKQSIKYYKMDIRDNLNIVFTDDKIDAVIHLAALKSVPESIQNPSLYYDVNVDGTRNLLTYMINHNVNNLIYSSSCAVYGQQTTFPVNEETPCLPTSPYGETKLETELLIKDYKIPSVILRYFNPIGSHHSELLKDKTKGGIVEALKSDNLTIYGNDYPQSPDGTCIRDFIHVMDLAEAHIKALEYCDNIFKNISKTNNIYEVINIGTGQGVTIAHLSSLYNEHIRKINIIVGNRREGDIPVIYADTKKMKSLLNWTPTRSLLEALQSV